MKNNETLKQCLFERVCKWDDCVSDIFKLTEIALETILCFSSVRTVVRKKVSCPRKTKEAMQEAVDPTAMMKRERANTG